MSEKATRIVRPSIGFVNLSDKNKRNFWRKVDKDGPLPDQSNPHYEGLEQCWSWTACQIDDGYGRIGIRISGAKHLFLAHRISWMIHFGEIPSVMRVLHKCDNGNCVNPAHLWLGTEVENSQDREAKGRANHPCGEDHHFWKTGIYPESIPRGEDHPHAKLTERTVLAIRAKCAGDYNATAIAREFGTTPATVYGIAKGKTWKHLL